MATATATAEPSAMLIDVRRLAELLGISVRHAWRMHDKGSLPACVRIGACVRWKLKSIQDWLDKGCPPCRKIAKGA